MPQAVSPKVPLSPRQVSCGPVARRHDRVAMSHVTGVSQIWPPKKTLWRTIHVASTVRSPRMVGALDSPGQDLPSSGRRDVTWRDLTWPDVTWRDMGPTWRVSGRPTGRSNRSNCPADGSGGCHSDRALSFDPGACYADANGWLSNRTMVEQCPKQCLTISQRRQRGEGQRWEPRDPRG